MLTGVLPFPVPLQHPSRLHLLCRQSQYVCCRKTEGFHKLLFSLLNLATSLGLQLNSNPRVVISSHVVMLSATLLRTLWSLMVCNIIPFWFCQSTFKAMKPWSQCHSQPSFMHYNGYLWDNLVIISNSVHSSVIMVKAYWMNRIRFHYDWNMMYWGWLTFGSASCMMDVHRLQGKVTWIPTLLSIEIDCSVLSFLSCRDLSL